MSNNLFWDLIYTRQSQNITIMADTYYYILVLILIVQYLF